jgi:predicted dehydrogenase
VNEDRIYRVGIVGLGRKAATIDDEQRWLTNYDASPCCHAAHLTTHPRTRIAAVCDHNPIKLDAFRRRWGDASAYTDPDEMLGRERLDIVSVTTHAQSRAEVSVAAAEAGVRGILAEKAMATSLAEADRMIEVCGERGVKLLVNHPRRFHPTYARALGALRRGEIGGLRAMCGMIYTALIHNGSHLFDMFRLFAGEADWVSASVAPGRGDSDPGGQGMIGFSGGVAAHADVASMQGFELMLLGEVGRIVINSFHDGYERWTYRTPDVDASDKWFQFGPNRTADVEHVPNPEGWTPPMRAAIDELIAAVDEDRAPASSGEDGRAALEMGLAFHASSAREGARVSLPLADREWRVVSR